MGETSAYNCVPSSSNDISIGAGKVAHKGTIKEVTSGNGSQY